MRTLCCYSVFLLLFSSFGLSQEVRTTVTRFDRDAGSWGGIHGGIQTNGAPFSKRLSTMIHYEHRFKDSFGLLVAMQVWRTRLLTYDGVQTYEYYPSHGSLMAAMKFRFPFRYGTPFVTGGIGSGMGLAPFILFYSVGFDIPISSVVRMGFDIRRTTIQEDSFFLLTGLLLKF